MEKGWIPMPDEKGYRGTGAPGKILDENLSIDGGGNPDVPDARRWELKYHSGSAPITMLHLDGQPTGNMYHMVGKYGKRDRNGRLSFRHTIRGQ